MQMIYPLLEQFAVTTYIYQLQSYDIYIFGINQKYVCRKMTLSEIFRIFLYSFKRSFEF